MVTISKIENNRETTTDDYVLVELRGLSTDEKPVEINNKTIDNGSMYIEIDSGKIYLYDLENEQWKEI